MAGARSLTEQSVRGVRHSRACSERSSDHGGFGDFGFRCAGFARVVAVDVDAIGALSRERDGHGNEFLVFDGDRAVGDGSFVECPKRLHDFGREGVHGLEFLQVFFVVHMVLLFGWVIEVQEE